MPTFQLLRHDSLQEPHAPAASASQDASRDRWPLLGTVALTSAASVALWALLVQLALSVLPS